MTKPPDWDEPIELTLQRKVIEDYLAQDEATVDGYPEVGRLIGGMLSDKLAAHDARLHNEAAGSLCDYCQGVGTDVSINGNVFDCQWCDGTGKNPNPPQLKQVGYAIRLTPKPDIQATHKAQVEADGRTYIAPLPMYIVPQGPQQDTPSVEERAKEGYRAGWHTKQCALTSWDKHLASCREGPGASDPLVDHDVWLVELTVSEEPVERLGPPAMIVVDPIGIGAQPCSICGEFACEHLGPTSHLTHKRMYREPGSYVDPDMFQLVTEPADKIGKCTCHESQREAAMFGPSMGPPTPCPVHQPKK